MESPEKRGKQGPEAGAEPLNLPGTLILFVVGALLVLLIPTPGWTLWAQTASDQLDSLLSLAQDLSTRRFAPRHFERAMEAYRLYLASEKQGAVAEAKTLAGAARDALRLAVVTAEGVRRQLRMPLIARGDAEQALAPVLASEAWNAAEELLGEACEEFEAGDAREGNALGKQAHQRYREAEFDAIRDGITGPARKRLREARESGDAGRAPLTLQAAEELLARAEGIIGENRYDVEEARRLAVLAEREVVHAQVLHALILRAEAEKRTPEQHLLFAESLLIAIAGPLGVQAAFHRGVPPVQEAILSAIAGMQMRIAADSLEAAEERVRTGALEIRLDSLGAAARRLAPFETADRDRRALLKEWNRAVEEVRLRFFSEGMEIRREGENVRLALCGLRFGRGSGTLDAPSESLLTRVADALGRFPGVGSVDVVYDEGIPLGYGSLALAQERAAGVLERLRPDPVLSPSGMVRVRGDVMRTGSDGRGACVEILLCPAGAGGMK